LFARVCLSACAVWCAPCALPQYGHFECVGMGDMALEFEARDVLWLCSYCIEEDARRSAEAVELSVKTSSGKYIESK
jgi:hypothetical protein